MSPLDDSLIPLYSRLQSSGLPCMIGGSIAAMAYGEPRATLDIDLIVAASPLDAAVVLTPFDDPRYQCPPLAVLQRELARDRDGSFQILDRISGLKADVYIAGTDPLLKYGLDNARTVTLESIEVAIASPNYIVAIKLRYFTISGREKHIQDIQSILRRRGIFE